ncbi:MAG TPA: transcriptional regulator, partial [Pseudoalteromonas sp.]|nr:transcriptional regulator [Pseudoalteromonas sp.]
DKHADKVYFPQPEDLATCDFEFFKMPQSRKNALKNLSKYCADNPDNRVLDNWLDIKGIGPWTVNYAKLRGQSNPDILLAGDLGVKKALINAKQFNPELSAPFRSYLTFQLWQQLS